ncbi:MiaB/RimO family radical SAM methylthiotransferase [Humisphaera borealis]|uniref:tRNA-2-methylthio-N(6)-dimethylallyladenosine synthase n=1 Tax=Humisphaera borealis TaxID=2807512 RepID=A0A7M2WYD9_9BACT|nr:MiaB/RimO family radical SAM methylthiotransferase [Humisphaera borealis]QOV90439.1 MiaB/RimO family radical SAM methylthiotransferase [Humisphaera borealis]
MPRKLYLETFGCQMNVLDSELVLGQLRAQGYVSTEDRESADVILYNTCSVREHAEQKVWSRLGELRQRKKDDPNLVIGVIGCMAERDGKNIFDKFPQVDILCGPGELDKLPGLIHNASVTTLAKDEGGRMKDEGNPSSIHPSSVIAHPSGYRQVALMGANVRRSGTLDAAKDNLEMLDLSRAISPEDDLAQAYVRITRGCNKFCTYCVVPYTRGPEVHRPPENIVDEVRRLADAGVREVTLLGQTINHYHFKFGDGRETSFAELLYQIHEAVPHLPRLRFVTSFPRDFTDEALMAMRDCERICRYLHVPAQHGSDRILKIMNRGYTAQQYRDFIDRARGYMPDISIASDFIVGFPTETEEEFQTCKDIIRHGRFKNSFIFKYSPRPGTIAIDRFTDDVPEDVKRRRNNELLAVQHEVSAQNNREMIGRTVQVLVEGQSKLVSKQQAAAYPKAPASGVELGWETRKKARLAEIQTIEPAVTSTQMVGRTSGDQVVVFDGEMSLKGRLLDVEIIDAKQMTLFARLAELPAVVP